MSVKRLDDTPQGVYNTWREQVRKSTDTTRAAAVRQRWAISLMFTPKLVTAHLDLQILPHL